MTRRLWWALTFLGIFPGLWLVLELIASFDHSDTTVPLTFYLVDLPWWAFYPLTIGFCAWFPIHLVQYRRLRHPNDQVAAGLWSLLARLWRGAR